MLFIYFARAGSLLLCVLFSTCGERVLLCSRRARASLVVEHGLWGARASVVACTGLWSTDSTAVVHGLVILGHVGSFWTIDGTCVSCIGRWILYH